MSSSFVSDYETTKRVIRVGISPPELTAILKTFALNRADLPGGLTNVLDTTVKIEFKEIPVAGPPSYGSRKGAVVEITYTLKETERKG